eukprot:6188498-Pleurochrysis_carterae.AAC.1
MATVGRHELYKEIFSLENSKSVHDASAEPFCVIDSMGRDGKMLSALHGVEAFIHHCNADPNHLKHQNGYLYAPI